MNNHASWMEEEGVCAACSQTDPSRPCDPRALKKKACVIVQEALKTHLLGRKILNLNANDSDVLPGA
jgi:hypothetical protein